MRHDHSQLSWQHPLPFRFPLHPHTSRLHLSNKAEQLQHQPIVIWTMKVSAQIRLLWRKWKVGCSLPRRCNLLRQGFRRGVSFSSSNKKHMCSSSSSSSLYFLTNLSLTHLRINPRLLPSSNSNSNRHCTPSLFLHMVISINHNRLHWVFGNIHHRSRRCIKPTLVTISIQMPTNRCSKHLALHSTLHRPSAIPPRRASS
mmetsp:Transcript_24381/g.70144  ORF Transcript_24381/g.70144 Transcript_24381/m.70144 type:complete len:200 (+) Transcript_24381:2066-2665(+)